ncbi:MAG: hypothetical protein ACE5J3_07165 [Methanosarcinales archaeon]
MKQVGVDSDFREYDARKGDLNDSKVAWKEFESNNTPNIKTIKGDFNGNGRVDIGDATYVAYMVVGKVPVNMDADFNNNGRVDIGDAAKIAYYVVGKIDAL